MRMRLRLAAIMVMICISAPVIAETDEEWVKLGARVHGSYGAFIPLGIRIGVDAMERLKMQPRQLAVSYHDSDTSPCACFADGVAIATTASFGQRTMTMAPQKAPPGAAAVIELRPRQGGPGLRYTIPLAAVPLLQEINKTPDPMARHRAVMSLGDGLFTREPLP